MLTPRRGLIAAATLLTLLYLFFHTRSPPPTTSLITPQTIQNNLTPDDFVEHPPILPDETNNEVETTRTPSRPYPPPSKPKQQKKPEEQMSTEDTDKKSLRNRLRYQFPYDLEAKFPAIIWQTWKYAPADGRFDESLRPMEASWTEKHPGFVHEVITDDAAGYLIEYLYASVPEVVEAYKAMPIPVLKADFFRYLILLARGGIYSDIDTRALKTTGAWLPEEYDRSQVGIIIGIEADPDRPDWADWYSRRIQFCQWTIQSKPGHPILRDIVASITEEALTMKQQRVLKTGKMTKSVMEFTGPAVWTDSVFRYFNNEDYFDFSDRDTNITYSDFFAITEHMKIGDVIVLPITSFSPGVQQMGAGDDDDPMAFVKHEFSGTFYGSLSNPAG
jgi:alpha 1,6-mannosyltransferase